MSDQTLALSVLKPTDQTDLLLLKLVPAVNCTRQLAIVKEFLAMPAPLRRAEILRTEMTLYVGLHVDKVVSHVLLELGRLVPWFIAGFNLLLQVFNE